MIYYSVMPLIIGLSFCAHAQTAANKVCGKWECDEKNLIIEVTKNDGGFKAKIMWFKADNVQLMGSYTDVNNPDPKLRSRKLIGMNVLDGLVYKPATNSWEDGMIYDSRHGRYWNSSAYINKDGLLKVKGYWHFKFIGHTMTFYRL